MQLEKSELKFQLWLAGFKIKATRNNFSHKLIERVFQDVTYDAGIISKDQHQPENCLRIWEYLDAAVSSERISAGQKALKNFRHLLAEISKEYGVPKEILVAIWGLESAYGSNRGDLSVLQSLASLAFEGRRRHFFETELIAALRILQAGDVEQQFLLGSWAGAMGHTQLMPTSFLSQAVDFNNDGKRNIWGTDPTDALASTGSYLKSYGWIAGEPSVEKVTLGSDFDYALAQPDVQKPSSIWQKMGVSAVTQRNLSANIIVPAGSQGPAFMTFKNFQVLLRYNGAVSYAFGVALFADLLTGNVNDSFLWPRDQPALNKGQRIEFQNQLNRLGFNTFGVDGIFGPNTYMALRKFQTARGLVADGFPTLEILKSFRQ